MKKIIFISILFITLFGLENGLLKRKSLLASEEIVDMEKYTIKSVQYPLLDFYMLGITSNYDYEVHGGIIFIRGGNFWNIFSEKDITKSMIYENGSFSTINNLRADDQRGLFALVGTTYSMSIQPRNTTGYLGVEFDYYGFPKITFTQNQNISKFSLTIQPKPAIGSISYSTNIDAPKSPLLGNASLTNEKTITKNSKTYTYLVYTYPIAFDMPIERYGAPMELIPNIEYTITSTQKYEYSNSYTDTFRWGMSYSFENKMSLGIDISFIKLGQEVSSTISSFFESEYSSTDTYSFSSEQSTTFSYKNNYDINLIYTWERRLRCNILEIYEFTHENNLYRLSGKDIFFDNCNIMEGAITKKRIGNESYVYTQDPSVYYIAQEFDKFLLPPPLTNTYTIRSEEKIITHSGVFKQTYDFFDILNITNYSTNLLLAQQKTNANIKIFIDIAEIEDGYQWLYIFPDLFTSSEKNYLTIEEIQHGPNKKLTTYSSYVFNYTIPLKYIKDNLLVVRYGATGFLGDNWKNKNIKVQMSFN